MECHKLGGRSSVAFWARTARDVAHILGLERNLWPCGLELPRDVVTFQF